MKGFQAAASWGGAYFKKLFASSLSLIFPNLCLHCCEALIISEKTFCVSCLQLLTLIDPSERCPVCFTSEDFSKKIRFCTCNRADFLYDRLGAAFDYQGPAATLTLKLKYGGQANFARGMAAFMYAQLDRLSWPLPDLIVPVPISKIHFLERGYNQSYLLACELAYLLNRPVVDCLRRKSGEFSQSGLSRKQRLTFSKSSVYLKGGACLEGKSVLILDDVFTTGSTLTACAEAIVARMPSAIYGLVFCKG